MQRLTGRHAGFPAGSAADAASAGTPRAGNSQSEGLDAIGEQARGVVRSFLTPEDLTQAAAVSRSWFRQMRARPGQFASDAAWREARPLDYLARLSATGWCRPELVWWLESRGLSVGSVRASVHLAAAQGRQPRLRAAGISRTDPRPIARMLTGQQPVDGHQSYRADKWLLRSVAREGGICWVRTNADGAAICALRSGKHFMLTTHPESGVLLARRYHVLSGLRQLELGDNALHLDGRGRCMSELLLTEEISQRVPDPDGRTIVRVLLHDVLLSVVQVDSGRYYIREFASTAAPWVPLILPGDAGIADAHLHIDASQCVLRLTTGELMAAGRAGDATARPLPDAEGIKFHCSLSTPTQWIAIGTRGQAGRMVALVQRESMPLEIFSLPAHPDGVLGVGEFAGQFAVDLGRAGVWGIAGFAWVRLRALEHMPEPLLPEAPAAQPPLPVRAPRLHPGSAVTLRNADHAFRAECRLAGLRVEGAGRAERTEGAEETGRVQCAARDWIPALEPWFVRPRNASERGLLRYDVPAHLLVPNVERPPSQCGPCSPS